MPCSTTFLFAPNGLIDSQSFCLGLGVVHLPQAEDSTWKRAELCSLEIGDVLSFLNNYATSICGPKIQAGEHIRKRQENNMKRTTGRQVLGFCHGELGGFGGALLWCRGRGSFRSLCRTSQIDKNKRQVIGNYRD